MASDASELVRGEWFEDGWTCTAPWRPVLVNRWPTGGQLFSLETRLFTHEVRSIGAERRPADLLFGTVLPNR